MEGQSKLASLAVPTLAVIAILYGLTQLGAIARDGDKRLDFSHYYVSAQFNNEGLNPYRTPLAPRFESLGFKADDRIPFGANPPLLIRLFSPIAMLPPGPAFVVWFLFESTCLVGLVLTIGRVVAAQSNWSLYLAMTAVLVNSTSIATHFYYSQVQLLVAWMIAGGVLLHIRQHTWCAVAIVALASAFKLYPAVLLPWFLLSRLAGPRDLFGRLAAGSAVFACVVVFVGPDAWWSFFHDGLPVIQLSVGGSWTNYSLPSFTRMLSGALAGDLTEPTAWSGAAGKALGLLAIVLAYARVARGDLKPAVAASLLVLAMMAASLVCWSHYFVLAAMPAAVLLFESRRDGWPSFVLAATLAALLVTPQLDGMVPVFEPLPLRVLLHFYPLAVIGLSAYALCRHGRISGGEA